MEEPNKALDFLFYPTIYEIMHDERLSEKSIYILLYINFFCDDENLSVAGLTKELKWRMGRESITTAVNQLIENGYLERIRYKKEYGSTTRLSISGNYKNNIHVFKTIKK